MLKRLIHFIVMRFKHPHGCLSHINMIEPTTDLLFVIDMHITFSSWNITVLITHFSAT